MQSEIRSLSLKRIFNYVIFGHMFKAIITEMDLIENKMLETGANLSFKVTVWFAGKGKR
jgi:hypothetical protein